MGNPPCPKCGSTEITMSTANGVTTWCCKKCGCEMASADKDGRIT